MTGRHGDTRNHGQTSKAIDAVLERRTGEANQLRYEWVLVDRIVQHTERLFTLHGRAAPEKIRVTIPAGTTYRKGKLVVRDDLDADAFGDLEPWISTENLAPTATNGYVLEALAARLAEGVRQAQGRRRVTGTDAGDHGAATGSSQQQMDAEAAMIAANEALGPQIVTITPPAPFSRFGYADWAFGLLERAVQHTQEAFTGLGDILPDMARLQWAFQPLAASWRQLRPALLQTDWVGPDDGMEPFTVAVHGVCYDTESADGVRGSEAMRAGYEAMGYQLVPVPSPYQRTGP